MDEKPRLEITYKSDDEILDAIWPLLLPHLRRQIAEREACFHDKPVDPEIPKLE